MFTTIAIIGTGNIGTWLLKALLNQEHLTVFAISGRKIEALPTGCDLYIFALKDDVYEDVLKQIPFKMPQVLHTSGSLSQNILAPYSDNFGVIYPYQTITENKMIAASSQPPFLAPICIEGCSSEFTATLFQWANTVFEVVCKINEQQRFAMHLAAVFASNFTNAMYGIAYQIFKENYLEWSLIFPLLENTLEKAKQNNPTLVQTGPAMRNDITIMKKHCDILNDDELRNLYSILSVIIQKKSSLYKPIGTLSTCFSANKPL